MLDWLLDLFCRHPAKKNISSPEQMALFRRMVRIVGAKIYIFWRSQMALFWRIVRIDPIRLHSLTGRGDGCCEGEKYAGLAFGPVLPSPRENLCPPGEGPP
jgi:hypothetical protein